MFYLGLSNKPKQRSIVGLLPSQLFMPLHVFFVFHVYHMALNISPHAVIGILFL